MERLTARRPDNGLAYLAKVKQNEQDVESPYQNTLKSILESFQRLAAYEETGLEPEEIPHWIPVSGRLPKKWRNENGEPIEFNVMLPGAKEATTLCFNGSQWFEFDWSSMRIAGYYTVIYWQPLPQPPKG